MTQEGVRSEQHQRPAALPVPGSRVDSPRASGSPSSPHTLEESAERVWVKSMVTVLRCRDGCGADGRSSWSSCLAQAFRRPRHAQLSPLWGGARQSLRMFTAVERLPSSEEPQSGMTGFTGFADSCPVVGLYTSPSTLPTPPRCLVPSDVLSEPCSIYDAACRPWGGHPEV